SAHRTQPMRCSSTCRIRSRRACPIMPRGLAGPDPARYVAHFPAPGVAVTPRQVRYLRGLAHHLDPVVQIGQARLTDALVAKVDEELENHELIKVRVQGAERHELTEAAEVLCSRTGAA